MAKCMNFSESFYAGDYETYDSVPRKKRPTCVIEAMMGLRRREWGCLCRSIGMSPTHSDAWEVLAELRERECMACDGYESPITVYLDPDGDIFVTVYE